MSKNHNIYFTTNFTEISCLDVLLEEVLGLTTNGTFLEIGAYDGITNSKTYHLANIGWQGIYVEPIKEYADKCAALHAKNNVKVICAAIADEDKKQIIYKGKLASTLLADNKDKIIENSLKKGGSYTFSEEEVEVLSWHTFLKNNPITAPNILVVDAEGCDWKIINNIDFSTFRPQLIFTEIFSESHKFMSAVAIEDGNKVKEKLLQNDYHIWVLEGHNTVFVDKKGIEVPHLLNKEARTPHSIFNLFDELNEHCSENLKQEIRARRGDVFLYSLLEMAIQTQNYDLVKILFQKSKYIAEPADLPKVKTLVSNLCIDLLKSKKHKVAIAYLEWLHQQEPENKILKNKLLLLNKL